LPGEGGRLAKPPLGVPEICVGGMNKHMRYFATSKYFPATCPFPGLPPFLEVEYSGLRGIRLEVQKQYRIN